MTNRKFPILEYGKDGAAALEACRDYLSNGLSFLNDKADLPDTAAISQTRFHGQALRPHLLTEMGDVQGRAIVVPMMDPKDRASTHDRHFDPWYFAAMRLFELPGGGFLLRPSKLTYYHVRYASPTNVGSGHQLSRIVANTPFWADTTHGGPLEKPYRDYRRASLQWSSKSDIKQLGLETRSISSERLDAIRFAAGLFKQQLEGREPKDCLGLRPSSYQRLLAASLHIADAVNEKLLIGANRRPAS
jgi:hypothetical protein